MRECNNTPTTGKTPSLISRLISRAFPEDPQAVVTLVSAAVLLVSLVVLVSGIAHQLWALHDIGWGTVGVLVVAIGGPCTLAHVKAPSMPVEVSASPACASDVSSPAGAQIEGQP